MAITAMAQGKRDDACGGARALAAARALPETSAGSRKTDGRLVCVAVVTRPHGVRGQFKLKCFTEEPGNVAAYGPVCDAEGRPLFRLEVVSVLPNAQAIARAKGVMDRDAAEALRGTLLHIPRSALPPVEDADEFYYDDLIGLTAVDPEGRAFGRVGALYDHGAGDILEIVATDGGLKSVVFTRATVPEVNLAAGRVVVVLPEEIEARPGPLRGTAGDAAGTTPAECESVTGNAPRTGADDAAVKDEE